MIVREQFHFSLLRAADIHVAIACRDVTKYIICRELKMSAAVPQLSDVIETQVRCLTPDYWWQSFQWFYK